MLSRESTKRNFQLRPFVKSICRRALAGCGITLAVIGLTMSARAQHAATDRVPTISSQPVIKLPDGSPVYGAGSIVIREKNSVFASIHSTGLEPGTAVSGWLVIINNPRNCSVRPCSEADAGDPATQGAVFNFGGRVVGMDGAVDLAEWRAAGDTTNALFGPGLQDSRGAEVQMVLRSHGSASTNPAILQQQLTTFNGGCPPNACRSLQISVHQP